MANNFPDIPGSPQNVVIRPLSKGVIRDLPPQDVPTGGMLEAKNYLVSRSGLMRRPVYTAFAGSNAVDYPALQDMQLFWTVAGLQKTIAWDQKFIYEALTSGYTGKYWVNTGNCSSSGTTVTGNGTLWNTAASEVQAGDIFVLDLDGSGDGPEAIEIDSITSDTELELVSTPSGTYGAGTDYEIRRAFDAEEPYLVDFTVVPGTANKMVFADGSRFLYSYDGTTFTDFNSSMSYIPHVVAYFKDRVWIGNVSESGSEYINRVRWSAVHPNEDDFDATGSGHQDLPYTQGKIIGIVPLNDYLIIYFTDAVWVGRLSNRADYPLHFQRVDTGNIGLVGVKAVVPWIGGHFFVGQDNIYFLSPSGGVQPMGDPIVARSVRECSHLWRVLGVHIPLFDSIAFAFPKASTEFEEIWFYNYKSKSWSSWSITGEMLSTLALTDSITYSTWVDEEAYTTGTVTGTGTTTVEGTGVDWSGAVPSAGDYIHIDEDGDGNVDTTYTIDSVTDSDTLETTAAVGTFTNAVYEITPLGSTFADLDYDSYSEIQPDAPVEKTLYFGIHGIVYAFLESGTSDATGAYPQGRIETPDLDLNLPDVKKTWLQLSLKVEEFQSSALSFTVLASVNRGQSWKSIGTLTIPADKDEGFLRFRTVGSICRFRLTTGSAVEPYTVNEMVIRARPIGAEIPGRND